MALEKKSLEVEANAKFLLAAINNKEKRNIIIGKIQFNGTVVTEENVLEAIRMTVGSIQDVYDLTSAEGRRFLKIESEQPKGKRRSVGKMIEALRRQAFCLKLTDDLFTDL